MFENSICKARRFSIVNAVCMEGSFIYRVSIHRRLQGAVKLITLNAAALSSDSINYSADLHISTALN